jgi:signal peptidase II
MKPFPLGLIIAALTTLIDQAQKLYCLKILGMVEGQRIPVTSFFDIWMVWNRGISYGLFQQNTDLGRWGLVAFKIIASIALLIWLWKVTNKLAALALGFIIGGAVGNAIDRASYGAVADFFHLHYGGISWYVFNIADCAIVVGVMVLLYEAWVTPKIDKKLP